MSASQPWDGTLNFSSYADVEASSNYASQAEIEAYRAERLAKYQPHVALFRSLGVPPAGLHVVDVGAGSSAFLYALDRGGLLERGVGIELSPSRHEFAERWRVDGDFARVTNIVGNFAEVPLEQSSFDRFTVLDDTYLLLRPEDERYPELLLETALRVLEPGGLFVAAFRNDLPVVRGLSEEGRSFWVELPETNAFRYALYRQQPSVDRRLLRNESIYITWDRSETRKVEITEVCDVAELERTMRRAGFGEVSLYGDFALQPFDAQRSRNVLVVGRR